MKGFVFLVLVLGFVATALAGQVELLLPKGATGTSLAWSPAWKMLGVVYRLADELRVRILEAPQGETLWDKEVAEIPRNDFRPPISPIAFTADGFGVAVATPWGIRVYSMADGRLLSAYPVGFDTVPLLLKFLRRPEDPQDYLALVIARAERWGPPMAASPHVELRFEARTPFWEVNDDARLGTRPLPLFSPLADFSPDGKVFSWAFVSPKSGEWFLGFVGERDGAYPLVGLLGEKAEPAALAVSPNGREVALGTGLKSSGEVPLIRRIDLSTGKGITAYLPCDHYQCFASGLDYSPDGKWLAYCLQAEGYVRLGLIDLVRGEEKILCQGDPVVCPGYRPLFSPDGKYLATLGEGGGVLWELQDGE